MSENETVTPVKPPAKKAAAKKPETKPAEDIQVPSTSVPADDIPNPFRPSDLTARIKKHAAAVGKKPEEIDPFQFIREHGLPNPVRLYRVTGTGKPETGGGKVEGEPMEIDAVDPTDATNQYIVANGIKEAHGWHFQHAVLAE